MKRSRYMEKRIIGIVTEPEGRSDRFRRILVVRARSRKGPLTEQMADVQPARRELVFMPLSGHFLQGMHREVGFPARVASRCYLKSL